MNISNICQGNLGKSLRPIVLKIRLVTDFIFPDFVTCTTTAALSMTLRVWEDHRNLLTEEKFCSGDENLQF